MRRVPQTKPRTDTSDNKEAASMIEGCTCQRKGSYSRLVDFVEEYVGRFDVAVQNARKTVLENKERALEVERCEAGVTRAFD